MKSLRFDPFTKHRLELPHVFLRPDVQMLLDYFPEIDLWDSLDESLGNELLNYLQNNRPPTDAVVHYVSSNNPTLDLFVPEAEYHTITDLVVEFTRCERALGQQLAVDVIALRSYLRIKALEFGLLVKNIPNSIETIKRYYLQRSEPSIISQISSDSSNYNRWFERKSGPLRRMKREIAKGSKTVQYNSLKFDLSEESQRLALTQQLGALEAELEQLEYFSRFGEEK